MLKEIKKALLALIDKSEVAFISSIDNDGYPTIKAMLALHHDDMMNHYFSTHLTTRRVAHYKNNPKASIYYCDTNDNGYTGLLLTGTVEICTDNYHKDLLWREGFEMYYPKGIDDENYCVLKFTATRGNYYHNLYNYSFTMEEIADDQS